MAMHLVGVLGTDGVAPTLATSHPLLAEQRGGTTLLVTFMNVGQEHNLDNRSI